MKVFVTGAGGFIGSHVCEELLKTGVEVKALVRYTSNSNIGFLSEISGPESDGLQIIRGDIRNENFVANAMRDCDAVMHLAALIGIPYSYEAPSDYIDVNVTGTYNVLNAALQHNITRVLVTSTSEVYGTALYAPITEEHPKQPQSPYSATKIAADALSESFHLTYDLPVTIVRPFNTYGPRQSERAFIPAAISQLLQKSQTVKFGDLTPTRDLVFVKDTARGFVEILHSETLIGEHVNISTGREHAVGAVVERLRDMIAPDKQIIRDERRIRPEKSEVFRLIGDASKLERHTSWSSSTSIEEGLAQTVDWFLENFNRTQLEKESEYVV